MQPRGKKERHWRERGTRTICFYTRGRLNYTHVACISPRVVRFSTLTLYILTLTVSLLTLLNNCN